jgi:hypothetical protein
VSAAVHYDQLPPGAADEIERLSRLLYELRRNRDSVLAPWGLADETTLLALIEAGQVDEHPAYDHYLSARILDDTRKAVRGQLEQRLREINGP